MSRRKGARQSGRSRAGTGAASASATTPWRPIILAGGLIVLATVATYYDSFDGPFVYDDEYAIVENPTIRQLWSIRQVFSPPCDGETVGGRPLLNLSFAVNYALGGLKVWGYHVTNLLIHTAAALLLFGILRRTFLMPALRDRFGQAAAPLALACAPIWALHPLQTESVTYIVQRAESLAGLCYLLTLYCVIRGAERQGVRNLRRGPLATSPARSPLSLWEREILGVRPLLWYTAAVVACLLGMATKEVMVTAPLVVLLYDRMFLSGSLAEALRRRWRLYLGLAATWALLACLLLSTRLIVRQAEMGAPDAFSYARSQPGIIAHYLRLSLWPQPLRFDYDWPVANTLGEILPGALIVGTLAAATVWGLLARKAWGFLGAWFLLILAPTSSILPLGQMAFEHRMYLPLAAVVVLAVAGGYTLWDRWLLRLAGLGGQSPFSPATLLGGIGLLGANKGIVPVAKKGTVPRSVLVVRWAVPAVVWVAVVLALGCATAARNRDYQSVLSLYQDTLNKGPTNAVAQYNVGTALDALGHTGEAMKHYVRALQLKPNYAEAHNNLGFALAGLGRTNEAIEHYQKALQLKPDYARAYSNWSIALVKLGRTQEAIERWQQALRLKPEDAASHNDLGNALTTVGKTEEAIAHYREALRLRPDIAEFHNSLAAALIVTGRIGEAVESCQCAVRLKPGYAEAHYNLGTSLSRAGRTGEAIEHFQEAVRLKPNFSLARSSLARVLAHVGRIGDSIEQYRQLLQQTPNSVDALCELAWLLATHEPVQGGDPVQAIRLAERARELADQENPRCLDTLAVAYAGNGQFSDAVAAAQRAGQLAESAGLAALAAQIQARLELYRAGRPYRESPRSAAQPDR